MNAATPTTSANRRFATASLVALAIAATAGCSSTSTASPSPSSGTNSSSTTVPATTTTVSPRLNMHAKRYCEVLALHPEGGKFIGEVYVSFPLNDCPEEQRKQLDTAAIAKELGVPLVVLNGPRYWLMDEVEQTPIVNEVRKTFAGMDMIKRATVTIESLATATLPYSVNTVDRKTKFTFRKGTTVYELTDPNGQVFVMQSWSQERAPELVESGLATLGSRIKVPAGWKYSSRVLDAPLTVSTLNEPARVIQDELKNSYSFESSN